MCQCQVPRSSTQGKLHMSQVLAHPGLSFKLIIYRAAAAVPSKVLQEYKETMTKTTNLEEHFQDVQIHHSQCISDEVTAERERLQEERESTEQCLVICTKAFEHLQEFDNKLQIHSSPCISDEATAERGQIQEEKESTEQCLAICTKALEHISQFQSNLSEEFYCDIISIPGGPMSSKRTTANALQECEDILTKATVDLEEHIQEINSKLQTLFIQGAGMLGEDATIQTNVFEDVLAAQDSHQVIVSPGNLISATRVTAGIEGRQWLGQMSDGTLQRLSYDWGSGRAAQQVRESQENRNI